ncbi:NADP-dependent oxidoreductase [Xanthomonas hortorum]|uniref:NADP-dependent oxidoreductase n=1 Tax=Xanthomonas hortorum pv. hederae TaxID=453603 RepID=A0A9X4H5Z0_9XANT|nr:NADP-dependent oxidoreductase [Xanthomonas hortorum]MCE4372372.1 NADP-dependent oxidoreductase [Xanthomonas hortorum pv. hederae]MDC8639835.1 NADP-dependent oxidoreductase [Xanthomonas hortorum pv. hederae]PPU79406.1 NADPH:quinone oxidoreductase [Xanthomonas hortorum pv. hederae]PUE99100.1 NADP-dependent oxidoreductase [Xanthomonas hortorum pv. hederae]
MKAFVIDRYGKKETGRIAEVSRPDVGDDDVLIRVHAASVNVLDTKIRSGEFKLILPYRLPLILGNDVAGTVVRVGANVRKFKIGHEVYARPDQDRIGSFAEFIAVKEASLALKPGNLSMEDAAAVPLVALTAWQVLVETAKLKAGQKVLIHAGSGGVGTIAIQLAKHLGAFVATTTGTSNVEWVKALGADVVIDYKTQTFETELQDYDVVLNSLGTDVLEKSLKVLKPGGQLISISGPPTPEFAADQGLAWPLKQALRLLSLGIRRKARKRGASYRFVFMRAEGSQLGELTSLIEAGIIKPVVDRIFALDSTAEALSYVERGRSKGKVVIRVS